MRCECNYGIRQQLLREGFVVFERFFKDEELQALQNEAEIVLEAAGAYNDADGDDDSVAKTRGCIFEVTRPFTVDGTTSGNTDTSPTAPGGLTPGLPSPPPGPLMAATTATADCGPAAVRLPGWGLLCCPRLHCLVRSALGFRECGAVSRDTPVEKSTGGASDAQSSVQAPAPPKPAAPASAADVADGPCLFNEQFIVKPPRNSSGAAAFGWHRDSDWCRGRSEYGYSPYVSVWTALDDMTAVNGALAVVPRSHLTCTDTDTDIDTDTAAEAVCDRAGASTSRRVCGKRTRPALDEHADDQEEGGAQWREAQPADPGSHIPESSSSPPTALGPPGFPREPQDQQQPLPQPHHEPPGPPTHLLVPPGTVVVFLDTLLHGSGPNGSLHTRRAWMPQFSSKAILRCADGLPVALAVPLSTLASAASDADSGAPGQAPLPAPP